MRLLVLPVRCKDKSNGWVFHFLGEVGFSLMILKFFRGGSLHFFRFSVVEKLMSSRGDIEVTDSIMSTENNLPFKFSIDNTFLPYNLASFLISDVHGFITVMYNRAQ